MSKDNILEGLNFETLKELQEISEAAMFDVVGEKKLKESNDIEEAYKDTVLEMATKYNKAEFYEKIKDLGLPRSSKLVRAVEPILQD